MKKALMLLAVLALVFSFVVGCSSEPAANEDNTENQGENTEEPTLNVAELEDGTYYAEEAEFAENGWKYNVTLEVKDGKIVDATWNGTHKDGGDDKVTQSENGTYGMVEKGDASAEWHEQAALVEAYLLETQDPTNIEYIDDEGHTDAIAGASIHVVEFFDLATEALLAGPTE